MWKFMIGILLFVLLGASPVKAEDWTEVSEDSFSEDDWFCTANDTMFWYNGTTVYTVKYPAEDDWQEYTFKVLNYKGQDIDIAYAGGNGFDLESWLNDGVHCDNYNRALDIVHFASYCNSYEDVLKDLSGAYFYLKNWDSMQYTKIGIFELFEHVRAVNETGSFLESVRIGRYTSDKLTEAGYDYMVQINYKTYPSGDIAKFKLYTDNITVIDDSYGRDIYSAGNVDNDLSGNIIIGFHAAGLADELNNNTVYWSIEMRDGMVFEGELDGGNWDRYDDSCSCRSIFEPISADIGSIEKPKAENVSDSERYTYEDSFAVRFSEKVLCVNRENLEEYSIGDTYALPYDISVSGGLVYTYGSVSTAYIKYAFVNTAGIFNTVTINIDADAFNILNRVSSVDTEAVFDKLTNLEDSTDNTDDSESENSDSVVSSMLLKMLIIFIIAFIVVLVVFSFISRRKGK